MAPSDSGSPQGLASFNRRSSRPIRRRQGGAVGAHRTSHAAARGEGQAYRERSASRLHWLLTCWPFDPGVAASASDAMSWPAAEAWHAHSTCCSSCGGNSLDDPSSVVSGPDSSEVSGPDSSEVSGPDSFVVRGPDSFVVHHASVVECDAEAIPGSTVTNEATNGPLPVIRGPLLGCGREPREKVTNEATNRAENVTNEATDGSGDFHAIVLLEVVRDE